MDLTKLKDSFDAYKEELKVRELLIKKIIYKEDYTQCQNDYINLYDKTNTELSKILGSIDIAEATIYFASIQNDPKYKELTAFFVVLLLYLSLSNGGENYVKIEETETSLYHDILKWYIPNHGISDIDKEGMVKEVFTSTKGSISMRNILACKEDLNSIFDNIVLRDERERQEVIEEFVGKTNSLLAALNVVLVFNSLYGVKRIIPKPFLLRLVLLNILTKKYQLGFSIEEYIIRYYQNNDITKELFGIGLDSYGKSLQNNIDELLMEINDVTNEFINYQQKKGKTN